MLFIGSIAGLEFLGAPQGYSVAKSMINTYAKEQAQRLASHEVRVNVVNPGNILFDGGNWDMKLKKKIKTKQWLI